MTSSTSTPNCSKELVYPELPEPGCEVDSNSDEVIVAILIIILVLVTFYRLLHVWAYTLNFSEVSILPWILNWTYCQHDSRQVFKVLKVGILLSTGSWRESRRPGRSLPSGGSWRARVYSTTAEWRMMRMERRKRMISPGQGPCPCFLPEWW